LPERDNNVELEKELKVYSYFTVDITPEKLTQIQNALQLARQNTLPGQLMYIPIAPGIAFRYAPEVSKKPIPTNGGPLPEKPLVTFIEKPIA
jgi:hypothetical protein